MARRPGSGRLGAGILIIADFGAIGWLIYSIIHLQWHGALIALSIAVAIPCWVVAVEAPTRCGVETLKGHPCPNPTTGLLLGCNNAKGHAWAKLFARFGWRRVALPRETSRRPAPTLTVVEAEPVLVKVAEDGKSLAVFWATMVSTGTGVISIILVFVHPS